MLVRGCHRAHRLNRGALVAHSRLAIDNRRNLLQRQPPPREEASQAPDRNRHGGTEVSSLLSCSRALGAKGGAHKGVLKHWLSDREAEGIRTSSGEFIMILQSNMYLRQSTARVWETASKFSSAS